MPGSVFDFFDESFTAPRASMFDYCASVPQFGVHKRVPKAARNVLLLLPQGVSVVPPGSALPGALRILEPALKRARKTSPAAVRFVTVGESGVIRVWDADK